MLVTIEGENFRGVPKVLLTGVGPDIRATGVNVTAERHINCSFDISNAKPGVWTVLVANPDDTSGELPNAFTITAPTSTPTPTETPTRTPTQTPTNTPEPTKTPTSTPTPTEEPRRASRIDLAADPPIAPVNGMVTIYAIVRDQFGEPMADQTVQFSVVEGEGNVDPGTAQTDASGQAKTELTSSTMGLVRVRATADSISNSIQVEFTQ